jgi:cell division protein ZapE
VYRAPLDAAADEWLEARWRGLATTGDAARGGPSSSTARHPGAPALPRARPGSTSPRCAKARAPPPTTSRSRASGPPCCSGGIPVFDGTNDDEARRFVHLVDEFYDRHVNLVCTADAAPPQLYAGERLAPPSSAPPRA